MKIYDLTDEQKDLLRLVVECDEEGRLSEKGLLRLISGDDRYRLWGCGVELESLADLEALHDVGLLSRERGRPDPAYRITSAGQKAVASNFEILSTEPTMPRGTIGQIVHTISRENVQAESQPERVGSMDERSSWRDELRKAQELVLIGQQERLGSVVLKVIFVILLGLSFATLILAVVIHYSTHLSDSFWDDLPQSLTAELVGSIVVFLTFQFATRFVEGKKRNRWIVAILVFSSAVLLLFASPLGSSLFPSLHDDFRGGMALSLGIEFVGALVIFLALERVLELLRDQEERERELTQRLESLEEVIPLRPSAEYASRPRSTEEGISEMTRQVQRLKEKLEEYDSLRTRVVGVLGQGEALSAESVLSRLNRDGPSVAFSELLSVIGTLVEERKVKGDSIGYLRLVED